MISFRSATIVTMAAAVAVPGHGSGLLSLIGSRTQSLPTVVTPIREADVEGHVEGDVVEVFVREGHTVHAGQPLIRIDDRISVAQVQVAEAVARSRAAIEMAESERRQAQRVCDRMLAAQARRAVADADVDHAIAGVELAEARLHQANEQHDQHEQQLKLEQARLNAHLMTAPFAGEVLRIERSIGASVEQGKSVMRIADISRLRAIVHMPFSWAGRLRAGQSIRVQALAPIHRLIVAEIVSLEPVIDPATETFRCVVEIDNRDRSLPSGFTIIATEQHLLTATSAEEFSGQQSL